MIRKGMTPEQKAQFSCDFAAIEPHYQQFSDDDPRLEAVAESMRSSKYGRLVMGYYVGFMDDFTEVRGEYYQMPGVEFGFSLYASIISQIPAAVVESGYVQLQGESLRQLLQRSFDDAVLPLLSLPADQAAKPETALGIKQGILRPGDKPGYTVAPNRADTLVLQPVRAVKRIASEVDEDKLAESGLSYAAKKQRQTRGHCGMPMEFHKELWERLTRTICLAHGYVDTDVHGLRLLGSTKVQ